MRILAHENSWCSRCKTWTLGPTCHWCAGTETVRYSPQQEAERVVEYLRFRAAGVEHEDALELLDLVAELVARDHGSNDRILAEVLAAGREPVVDVAAERAPVASRPLLAPAALAVAA